MRFFCNYSELSKGNNLSRIVSVCFWERHSLVRLSIHILVQGIGKSFIWQKESEVTQSCPTLCDPVDCSLPGSSVHGILQARILEWVVHFLLQGIFPIQGSKPGLPHCRQMLYPLSHQGSPYLANMSHTHTHIHTQIPNVKELGERLCLFIWISVTFPLKAVLSVMRYSGPWQKPFILNNPKLCDQC